MNINTILVAIDIEESSSQIIDFGFQLASKKGAELSFLYVQKLDIKNPTADQIQLQEGSLFTLIEQVEAVAQKHPNTEFKCDVMIGFPKDKVLEYTTEYDHDLIILGIHNQNKLFNMTGISYPLVNESTKPVILIPDSYRSKSLDHILFAIEFEFEEIDPLFDMIKLADHMDGYLTCIHVDDSKGKERPDHKIETYKRLLEPYLQEGKLELDIINGKIADSLRIFASENEVDLIVIMKERKNWKTQYLQSSKEKKLTKKVNIPVMILNQ